MKSTHNLKKQFILFVSLKIMPIFAVGLATIRDIVVKESVMLILVI